MIFQLISHTCVSFSLAFLCGGILIYLLYSQLESFKRHLMQSLRDDSSSVCLFIYPIDQFIHICLLIYGKG
jgi:hypothetical protein